MPQKHIFSWIDPIPLVSQVKALCQFITGNKVGAKITNANFISSFVSLLEPGYFRISHPPHYSAKKKSTLSLRKWMEKLDDSALVTTVSLPGTHDSGCRIGGEFAKCQTWSIPEQLKAGIRFLDIRCRNIKNEFHVVHGIIHCHLTFDKVIKYCEDFLFENPSEFIVMRLKKESSNLAATKSFDEVYREYASKDIFLKPSPKEVTVKEARGKILVLRDFWGKGTGTEWNFYDSIMQDNYEPPSVQAKFQIVEEHFKNATPHPTKFHINFLSACTPHHNAWPRYFARHINKMVLSMIQDPERRSFGGIIAMDFPGEGIITEIVGLNIHCESNST